MTVRQSFGFPLSAYVHTDVGRVRSNNEDSFGHAWLGDGSLFVMVADGMGGHEAGEVASGLAVRVAEEAISRDVDADPRERLYNGLLEANDAILEEGRASGTRGMGTTAIAAILRGPEIHVGQIGDSRLYHIRHGQMVWRTLDHTRVQMLLDNGEIADTDARHHPEAGMLTRALGHSRMADGRPLVPDVLAEPLEIEPHDALVLCSDGLHDLLEDWEIGQLVAGRSPQEAAQVLIEEACNRGGHDNITVAVVVAGERSSDFDPDFVPESAQYDEDEEYDDSGALHAEVTYEGVANLLGEGDPSPRSAGRPAAPPSPGPQGASAEADDGEGGSNPRMMMMAAGAILLVLALGLFAVLAILFGVMVVAA